MEPLFCRKGALGEELGITEGDEVAKTESSNVEYCVFMTETSISKYDLKLIASIGYSLVDWITNTIPTMLKKRSSLRPSLIIFVALLWIPIFSPTASAQDTDDLPQLLASVWGNHPTLKAKRADRNATRAGVTVAERQFWPTPSVSSDIGPADAQGRTQATTARITYPLYTGGQLSADLEIADLKHRLSETEIEIVGRDLVMQFIDLYRTWWLHSSRIDNYQIALVQMDSLLQTLKRRASAGVSAKQDLAQAELQWLRMQDDLRQTFKQRDQLLADMVTFAGQDMRPKHYPLLYWPRAPFAQIPDLTARVLATHPSISLSDWQTALAQAELKRSKASTLPNISIRLEKQYGAYQGTQSPASRVFLNSQYTLGAGLAAIPLQEQAMARAAAAEKQAEATRLTLTTLVQRTWHERAQANEQIISTNRQLKLQKDLSDSAVRLFTAGRRSLQDLLSLQRELHQLQAQKSEAESVYLSANWRLHLLANTLPMFSFPSF